MSRSKGSASYSRCNPKELVRIAKELGLKGADLNLDLGLWVSCSKRRYIHGGGGNGHPLGRNNKSGGNT